jgi:hypothetical protein
MSVTLPRPNHNPGEGPEPFADADLVGQADDYPEGDRDSDPWFAPLDPSPAAVLERCLGAMARWPLKAIGNRPADWLAHDLLVYTLLRDARLSYFHRLLKEPESWLLDYVAAAGEQTRRGLQLAALHFLHLRQLDEALRWVIDADYGDAVRFARRWQRLWNCRPYGAVYDTGRAAPRCCGLVHLCPWCRARAGVRLWQRLRDHVGQRTLLLLRHSTTSYDLEVVAENRFEMALRPGQDRWGFSWLPPEFRPASLYEARPGAPTDHRYASPRRLLSPLDLLGPIPADPAQGWEPYALLTERQVRAAREHLHRHLDYWAARLGIVSGLKVLTVGPDMHHDDGRNEDHPQHRFTGSLLGEPPAGGCPDPQLREALLKEGVTVARGVELNHLTEGQLRSRGGSLLVTALAVPPLLLLWPGQWASYAESTAGWPLYRAFGAWRRVLAERGRRPGPFPPRPAAGRPPSARERREEAARAERERLLGAARPLWAKARETGPTGRRGRPACKRRLRELLAGQGLCVTRRQLDRLMADLKRQAP